jgi:hypothetical protein
MRQPFWERRGQLAKTYGVASGPCLAPCPAAGKSERAVAAQAGVARKTGKR